MRRKIICTLVVFISLVSQTTFSQTINVITRAAEAGDVDAQKYLGKLYAEGDPTTKKDLALSYKWYLAAAKQGDAEAQHNLGTEKYVPIFLSKEEAAQWKEQAALNGFWLDAWTIGREYLDQNNPKAFKFLSQAGPIAFIDVAQCYLKGIGIGQDVGKAKEYLKDAIDINQKSDDKFSKATIAEAYRLLSFISILEKDVKSAIEYSKLSGQYGFSNSYFIAGNLYRSIDDDSNAYKMYELAAKDDNLEALVEMALFREYGKGVKQDYDKSIQLYNKALSIDQSYMPAIYGIGWIYYKQNEYSKARMFFEKAAKSDEPEGYNGLAYLAANGYGGPKDIEAALKFIDKALSLVDDDDKGKACRYLDSKGDILLIAGDIERAKLVWQAMNDIGDYDITDFTINIQKILQNSLDTDIPKNSMINSKCFAFIIGNEQYQRVSKVPYANNDAKIFAEYCRKTLGIPEKNVRMYENATYGTMIGAMSDLQKIAKAFKGDINVVFYYAGHGIPNETTGDAYLLPVDADGMNTEVCYSLSRLYKELGELGVQRTIVFMDACFSGAERGNGMVVAARGVAIKPKTNLPTGNTIVFSAASGNQTAYPYEEKGHGLFTYYLLKKLHDTKGNVTLGELGTYICDEAAKQAVLNNGKEQTPMVLTPIGMGEEWKKWKLKE